MVNVFGESVGSGSVDLQLVKKVVVTKGQYKDYVNEMQQSYEFGFPPYRLHTNGYGTFVIPIRVYNGKVYVLDDVTTMEITGRHIVVDETKLVYFVEADDGSGVALKGDRGPSGVRCLKGDSGGQGPSGRQGPAEKRGAVGSEGPPGKIGKLDRLELLEVKAVLENMVKKGTREMLVLVDLQDLLEAKAMLELVVKKVKKEMSVALVPKGQKVQGPSSKRQYRSQRCARC